MRIGPTCVVAALTILCGCQRDISGTYLASDTSAVVWLQLVRTPDNHLTGQLSLSKLNADGKVGYDSVSLAGVIGEENVTLSGSRFMGLQTFSFAGTLDGNKLTLTSSETPMPFELKRADMSDYQKQLGRLNAASATILAAKTAALRQQEAQEAQQKADQAAGDFAAAVDQLIAQMQRFDSEADVHLGRFPGVEKGYRDITAKISGYVLRERQLASNPDASVTRSQLSVAASQASFATDQIHNDGQSLESLLDADVKPTAEAGKTLEQRCRGGWSGLTVTQMETRNDACSRYLSAAPTFRQKYDAVEAGLAHLEQVYTQEKTAQEALLQTAQKLQ